MTATDSPKRTSGLWIITALIFRPTTMPGGDLTAMLPWRGVPILRPREFVGRVDAMRRYRRHR